MDEMIQEGHLDTQAPPSPTPSEILRQEGTYVITIANDH